MSVQVTIRDIPHSNALEDHILNKAEKLTQYCQRINSCRVVIDQCQKHKHQGKLFNVKIDLTVPGKELVVNRKMNEDVYVAIRDAFDAILRQLETYVRKHRGQVKKHETASKGVVERVFEKEGYGFIHGVDGIEYYYSPVNVSHPDFAHLQIGDTVEFLTAFADDGQQAHHIKKIRHNNLAIEGI